MNWNVAFGVLALFSCMATICAMAAMMTSFEFDGARGGLKFAALVVVLAVLDAVLIGLAVPS